MAGIEDVDEQGRHRRDGHQQEIEDTEPAMQPGSFGREQDQPGADEEGRDDRGHVNPHRQRRAGDRDRDSSALLLQCEAHAGPRPTDGGCFRNARRPSVLIRRTIRWSCRKVSPRGPPVATTKSARLRF